MQKFASLIELTSTWESLPNEEFAAIVKRLLEIDTTESYKKAIISGIFQQLYDEGDTNDDMFYADLLVFSRELEANGSTIKKKLAEENHFERLPDSLLCNIASYLSTRDIFSKWNHVNRKFIQIGLKPQCFTHFEWNEEEMCDPKNAVKFKLDVTLSKLESLHITENAECDPSLSGMKHLLNEIPLKSTKCLTLGSGILYAYFFTTLHCILQLNSK